MGISIKISLRPNTLMDNLEERFIEKNETVEGVLERLGTPVIGGVDMDGNMFTHHEGEAYRSFMADSKPHREQAEAQANKKLTLQERANYQNGVM